MKLKSMPGAAILLALSILASDSVACDKACADSDKSSPTRRLQQTLDRLYAQGNTETPLGYLSARVVYPRRGIDWAAATGSSDGAGGAPAGVDQPFRIASVTKTFVAAATLKLVETGRLELDGAIATRLSDASAAALRAAGADPDAITLRQLLNHRSGLFDYASTLEYFAAVQREPQRRWSRIEQLQFGLALLPPVPADLAYIYSDTNYILLGEIIERSTALPLATALRQLIDYGRLDLRSTWLESLEAPPADVAPRLHQSIAGVDTSGFDPSFDLWGGGGLVSTTGDLARFYRALFRGRVISRASLRTMTQEVAGGGFGEEAYTLGLMPFYIGSAQCFGHTGVRGVLAAHCPDIDFTVVVTAGNLLPGIDLDTQRRGPGTALAAAVGLDVAPRPFTDDLRRTACPPELESSFAEIYCGMLRVPENHTRPDGVQIELATIYARHKTRTATLDPLLVLGGGPGNPLFPDILPLLGDRELGQALLGQQDLVLIEQRGVGASQPSLNCPSAVPDLPSALACIDTLANDGIDLGAYTTEASVKDLEVLRRALRTRQWNVIGFSYGTKLALSLAREHPSTIRSLTLDGVDPPAASITTDPPRLAEALELVLSRCAADGPCSASFPNLKARFLAAVAALNEAPVDVDGNRVTGDTLVGSLFAFQGSPDLLAYFPAVLDGFARGDQALFAALYSVDPATLPDDAGTGMFFSVTCSDEAPVADAAALARSLGSADPLVAAYARIVANTVSICAQWPAGRAPDRVGVPTRLPIPTLAFNAEFDLQTPPRTGREFAATQPQVRAIEFRGVGHVATQQASACAVSVIVQFQRRADPQRVDAGCATQLPSPQWKPVLDATFYALIGAEG